MGSQSSKSVGENEKRDIKTRQLLTLFRSSSSIVVCKYNGAEFPEKVRLNDGYDANLSREDLIGLKDIVEFDSYEEDLLVSPRYGGVLDSSDNEKLKIAIRLSDIITVRQIIGTFDANCVLDEEETALEIACGVSQISDHFTESSLNTTVTASDGVVYSRQIDHQDAIDVVKLLLNAGATITERALENAQVPAYGVPKMTLLKLLSRCCSDEMRESNPIYQPNTTPLEYALEVKEYIKGTGGNADGGDQKLVKKICADKRVEGEISDELLDQYCIMFMNGEDRIAAWASNKNCDSYETFENALLFIKSVDADVEIAPGFVNLKTMKNSTFDKLEYELSGPLAFTSIDMNVKFNVLDDWETCDVKFADQQNQNNQITLDSLGSPDTTIVGHDFIELVWGKSTSKRGMAIVGTLSKSGSGSGSESSSSIAMQFVVKHPKIVTRRQWSMYTENDRWNGLTHICKLKLMISQTQPQLQKDGDNEGKGGSDVMAKESEVICTLTIGSMQDVLLGLPRAPILNLRQADAEDRTLAFIPEGADKHVEAMEGDSRFPSLTLTLGKMQTQMQNMDKDTNVDADISTSSDPHPCIFVFLKELLHGSLNVMATGLGYGDEEGNCARGTLTLDEVIMVDDDGAKLHIPYDENVEHRIEESKLKKSDGGSESKSESGSKTKTKREGDGVMVCGEYVTDAVFYAGLSDDDIAKRIEQESETVDFIRKEMIALSETARKQGLSKSQFIAQFEELFLDEQHDHEHEQDHDHGEDDSESHFDGMRSTSGPDGAESQAQAAQFGDFIGDAMGGVDVEELMTNTLSGMDKDGCQQGQQ